MITIRNTEVIVKDGEGVAQDWNVYRVEFDIDATAELPTDGTLQGYVLYQGSICFDISTGKFYVLDSEGAWHDSKDGTVVTPS